MAKASLALFGFFSRSGMLIKKEVVLLGQINIELGQGKIHFQAVMDT